MAEPANVVVYWPICCFDKRRENPLPVYTRFFVLDEARATDEEKGSILEMIHRTEVESPDLPLQPGQQIMTVAHGVHGISRDILRCRHLFRECGPDELRTTIEERSSQHGGTSVQCVSLIGDYFEDENGKEVTEIEMMDHVSGGGPVIIMGNPQSVTRLGPAGVKEADQWTVETANTFAQFFQVVDHIAVSRWYQSPASITLVDGRGIVHSAFPSVESALGILLLLRQLYSSDPKDDLLNRACGAYLRHADHLGKSGWVRAEKDGFNEHLKRPPPLPGMDVSCSTRELLDVFLYGAGLVHSRGKDGRKQEGLHAMLRSSPREKLVMAFHASMKCLFSHALKLYPVMKQDFLHWVNALGLRSADAIDIGKLLRGGPS